jgi:hypothetical protein
MLTGSAKPSAGITASAVIALLGSVVAILFGGLMALSSVAVSTSSAARPPDQPLPSIAAIVIMAGIQFGFGAWGIASAVGLLLLRKWARFSFLIFGGLLAFFSFCAGSGLLFAAIAMTSTLPPTANVSPGLFTAVMLVFTVISVICLAVAVWWLVYFNRSSVKAQFGAGAVASQPRQFPLAVSIIAWVFVVGGVVTAVQMLFSYPLVLFGIVLRGWASSLVLALLAAISLSAGIGLLKKRVEAHSLAVGYSAFGILNVVSYIVLPGSFARMQEVMRETQRSQTAVFPPSAMNSLMVFVMLIGLIFTGAILVLLIKARRPFIEACHASLERPPVGGLQ